MPKVILKSSIHQVYISTSTITTSKAAASTSSGGIFFFRKKSEVDTALCVGYGGARPRYTRLILKGKRQNPSLIASDPDFQLVLRME